MPQPSTVIAYHVCWTVYGTWLPNDPRGSGSRAVATPQIAELGEPHLGRRKVQPPPAAVREFKESAQPRLKFSVLNFDAQHIESIAAAFADTISQHAYTCYACAILPDHVHLVLRKHKHRAEAMIENLQRASRLRLCNERQIPRDHPCWTAGGWRGFLNSPAAVRRVIRYVENNPRKAGLPPQTWEFITPYDNWPFHKRGSLPKD